MCVGGSLEMETRRCATECSLGGCILVSFFLLDTSCWFVGKVLVYVHGSPGVSIRRWAAGLSFGGCKMMSFFLLDTSCWFFGKVIRIIRLVRRRQTFLVTNFVTKYYFRRRVSGVNFGFRSVVLWFCVAGGCFSDF